MFRSAARCRCWSMRAKTSGGAGRARGGDLALFAELERLDARGVHDLCPLLKDDARHGIADRDGIRLDPHALLQGNLRQLRASGGELRTGARVAHVERAVGRWEVTTESGERFSAPVWSMPPGAWADRVAELAGVRPIGLQPKRRTIITFDAPPGTDARSSALRQDGRRRTLFRAGERPPVRLADGRGAERAVRRAARRI